MRRAAGGSSRPLARSSCALSEAGRRLRGFRCRHRHLLPCWHLSASLRHSRPREAAALMVRQAPVQLSRASRCRESQRCHARRRPLLLRRLRRLHRHRLLRPRHRRNHQRHRHSPRRRPSPTFAPSYRRRNRNQCHRPSCAARSRMPTCAGAQSKTTFRTGTTGSSPMRKATTSLPLLVTATAVMRRT